jgi:hypothetical protein
VGHIAPFDYLKINGTLHEAYHKPKKWRYLMGSYNLTFIDHDTESSTFGLRIPDLNAGNITAQLALLATLRAAVEAVSIGTLRKEETSAIVDEISGVAPADGFAQRETKWLVSGVDSTGLPCTLEIPCANLDLLASGTGTLDISTGEGQDLADALNAVWRSRAGNAVTVSRIIHVGRNI